MTSVKALGLALVGAGNIAASWSKAIAKTRGVRLRMVADIEVRKARKVAALFPGCVGVASWRKVLRSPGIDAVLVATPHKFLSEISRQALLAGKHVLSEKPGGVSPRAVIANVRLARKNRLRYMVGFNHRFHPAFQAAKKFFDSGKIGKPLFVRARYGFGGRPGMSKEWRLRKSVSGGGELIDQGVHMIDLARLFLGDFVKVRGFVPDLFWGTGVDDNAFVLMQTRAGQTASVHVSLTNWKWVHSFEIFGTKGYLLIDGLDQRYQGPERLTIGSRDPEFKNPPKEKTVVFKKERKEDSFARELAEFLNAVRKRRDPDPDGIAAYETLKVVKKIYGK